MHVSCMLHEGVTLSMHGSPFPCVVHHFHAWTMHGLLRPCMDHIILWFTLSMHGPWMFHAWTMQGSPFPCIDMHAWLTLSMHGSSFTCMDHARFTLSMHEPCIRGSPFPCMGHTIHDSLFPCMGCPSHAWSTMGQCMDCIHNHVCMHACL